MDRFEINILGCGSASPTLLHYPTSQVVSIREKLFMVDCGENSQLQFRKNKLSFTKLSRIFISHLHGDHCFGLIGLISTLGLLGRTSDLYIHAHADLEGLLRPQLDYFCRENPFKIIFEAYSPTVSEVIYEDRSVRVATIPLKHRVPCAGFRFDEQPKGLNLKKDMFEFYNIPLKDRGEIKKGADYVTADGQVIPNAHLTTPGRPLRSYAYCSDTAYKEDIIPIIENVNLLYHEATFAEKDASRAVTTMHSTARQAALIAKQANVGELMLGHFSSRYPDNTILLDEAKEIFPNTVLANEGMIKKL